MRIVHLNPFYFPYAGGIERRIRALARRMAGRHEVHVVTAQQPGGPGGIEVEEGGVTVHRLPSRFPLRKLYNPPYVATPGLADRLASLAPDVVDYHFRWSPSYNRAFRGLDCGRVATYHNTYGEGQGLVRLASLANDRLFMRTLRRADRVVCVSGHIRDELASRGVPAERLVVSPNAIEPAPPPAPPPDPPAPSYAVAVGRVVAVKGFDILVRAWRDAPRGLHLVVVGEGPARGRLEKLAERLGVREHIHFTGWVAEERKRALVAGAEMYLHPARSEAFGISILEAMALGAPVVAARTGGIPEVVGDAGRLLDHEPSHWAAAAAELHGDDGLRRRISAASRRQAATFDWDTVAAGMERTYAEAAAAAG